MINTEIDAGDSQPFNTVPLAGAGQAVAPAPAGMEQAEPTEGGSYVRNLATGALEKVQQPAAQPDQE